ncbi:putative ribonuclease H-like domain-containing protein [Tanacetum coccineum]
MGCYCQWRSRRRACTPPAPKTAKQLAARRNQERVKSILLLAIPNEYLLKFHNVVDANKSLWEAIKSRFGGNVESKKIQLEVHGAPISKEDINQKFLRSLPSSWNQIALIMRNKPDIDEIDIDDLYNNLRVYEYELKRSSGSNFASQNLAFLSFENIGCTNEVSTANRDFEVSTAGGINQVPSTPCAHDIAYSFLAQPTTSPQLENEDFQQMDGDDLEELDLRWQVAMLTVRVKKFIQRIGRNMDFKEKRPVSLDKSKIECYNCHRKGHFARECRSGRSQGRRSYGDNGRSNAPTNESSSQALVAQDGLGGYDWSNDFEVEPVNYALMAISSSSSSSSSDSEVQKCSKQCLESFKCLQKNYDTEREKHNKAKLEIRGYEIALESLESRIIGHEKNELAWGEKYEFQNYELKCREIKINNLNLELEKAVKERDELKDKIAKWEESTKNLEEILKSQMSARDKTGLGYSTQLNELSSNHETDSENSLSIFDGRSSDDEHIPENDRFSKNGYKAVPPPITGNFLTPRADISFAGLDEYAIRNKIIESQTTELNNKTSETAGKTNDANTEKPKSVSESVVSNPKINRDSVIIEDWTSDDEEEVSGVQKVRPENQTVKTRDDKSGQNSHKQGVGFRKVKACFVCRSTEHLIKDCNFHDKKSQESNLKNVVNTGKREGKPVWDNTKRGNQRSCSQVHVVVDSVLLSSMTGNKSLSLQDYEDLMGGLLDLWEVILKEKASTRISTALVVTGKSPSISFMRPFGCPLTILNTLDSLGKFDGKSDEGYLLGYSTSSKAFRSTITEASVRSKLQLADATGIHNLSDAEIYAGLATLGYVTEGADVDQGEGLAQPTEPHHTPVDPSPPHPSPPHLSPPHQSPPHSPYPSPLHHSPPQSPPHLSPPRSYEAPLSEGNTSGSIEDSMQLKELMVLVPTLLTRINSLEKELKDTKHTLGNATCAQIVKKVKFWKKALKRCVSKEKSTDKGKRYMRKARSMAKKIDTGLDAEEEINTGREEINTGIEEVSTGSTKVDSGTTSKRGQREGKAPMVVEHIQATHKTKEQMRQEEVGLKRYIVCSSLLDEEVAKKIHKEDSFR